MLMKVLFVCKSNFGRSQIAEAIFNSVSKEHVATSAGAIQDRVTNFKLMDFPEHENLFTCMDEIGIELRNQIAKQLTLEMVDESDKIIVMAEREFWPEFLQNSDKVTYWEIEDMCNKSLESYREARDQIRDLVEGLAEELG